MNADFKSHAANDTEPLDLAPNLAAALISPATKLPSTIRGLDRAMQSDLDDSPMGWVNACLKGSYESMVATLEEPTTKDWDEDERMADAKEAAATTFLLLMPTITSKRRAQCFIACAAAAQLHGYISGERARALLYTAQLAISAHGKPSARRSHEPRQSGGAA